MGSPAGIERTRRLPAENHDHERLQSSCRPARFLILLTDLSSMSLESLLCRASEAVGLLTTMGWAPAENIAQQNAGDMQSIYNALAAKVQGSPNRLNNQEKHVIFELSCKIWVCSLSQTFVLLRDTFHVPDGLIVHVIRIDTCNMHILFFNLKVFSFPCVRYYTGLSGKHQAFAYSLCTIICCCYVCIQFKKARGRA